MADGLQVIISTEQLAAASGNIAEKASRLREAFEEMTQAVENTNGYWIGEAAEAHRKAYRSMQPHQEEVLKRLEEQSADLARIAGVWEEAERQITERNASLPDDVIV